MKLKKSADKESPLSVPYERCHMQTGATGLISDKYPSLKTFFEKCPSPKIVIKLLKDLNPHKAAGPDELKPLVLRELREVIAPMLVVIFQRSIETGRVPKDWNDAIGVPCVQER